MSKGQAHLKLGTELTQMGWGEGGEHLKSATKTQPLKVNSDGGLASSESRG